MYSRGKWKIASLLVENRTLSPSIYVQEYEHSHSLYIFPVNCSGAHLANHRSPKLSSCIIKPKLSSAIPTSLGITGSQQPHGELCCSEQICHSAGRKAQFLYHLDQPCLTWSSTQQWPSASLRIYSDKPIASSAHWGHLICLLLLNLPQAAALCSLYFYVALQGRQYPPPLG